jgi:hypothetical protein
MTWHTNKNSEVFTCSQERVEEYLQTLSSDMKSLEPARLKNTQEMSCSPDSETESCQPSRSGTTSAHSTEHPGEEQLMFFAEASHVRTSVLQVKEQELQGSVRDFGRNMRDSLERCGLALSLPKTHLCFALGDLELSSKTWPRWGIMQDGECSELGMSVRHINETECGSWRTPCTRDYKGINAPEGLTRKDGKSWMDQLPNAVAYGGTQTRPTYCTPRVKGEEHFETVKKRKGESAAAMHNTLASVEYQHKTGNAQLNPDWVEWLMGWPISWTSLEPLSLKEFRAWHMASTIASTDSRQSETDKLACAQPWHSIFSQKD